jgi:uncharacterized protein
MTQPAKSQEPSMEEILASIRRIIADDDANKSAQRAADPPPPAPRPAPVPLQAVPEQSLNDSHAASPAAAHPEAGADAEDQSSDILDLTDSMAVVAPPAAAPSAEPPPQFRKIEGGSDVSFDDASEKPAMQRAVEVARRELGGHGDDERERSRLISKDTSAAINSAFNTLAQTVLVQNARTLEDLVREMLRPMLKEWLDDNLPGMVERLVRAEIERVSRGRS